AIEKKEQIIIFGDYDADGVSGTAILWETLNSLSANVMPYIPHRVEEGYGLSVKGIENLLKTFPNTKLIITVDNGIVANKAVEFANSLGLDVIITDHHVPGKNLPKAYSIVHSTKICGAGVAWFFSKQIKNKKSNLKSESANGHLALVALATVADVMPLNGFNRTLLKIGLESLKKTKRIGLIELFKLAAIDANKIGAYEIGHIIAPRLNAMGRIQHAMDSLRLICTNNKSRAQELAQKLNSTNLERQQMTLDSFLHAKGNISEKTIKKILFIAHESYEPGVIGLIAGKLTEEFYRPSIVLSIGKEYSKASARSIAGFNIIEFIRLSSDLLVDAGGHPMAAGFTVETKNITKLQKLLEKLAEEQLADGLLVRKLKIDCELDLDLINEELFAEISKLAPFGQGNPEPAFLSKGVVIENMQIVGKDGRHLRIQVKSQNSKVKIGGILFGYDQSLDLKIGDKIDIVYVISQNEWNGNKKLELKIKDIKS
ncbi:MAG: single-stranded-DNA-specific exonuclease RecJ, partial [Candidatus Levybacteria bacterium]|nr:single-stranded-DNA-specific exonuclease RecJ [Candidatus Levybacteria bacterium]